MQSIAGVPGNADAEARLRDGQRMAGARKREEVGLELATGARRPWGDRRPEGGDHLDGYKSATPGSQGRRREELAEGRLQDEDSAPLPRGGTAQALAGLAARPPHEGVLLVGAGARRQRPEQRAARGRHDDDREGLGRGPAHGPGLVPEARQQRRRSLR
ncbi:unnamed protein product, partial [Prorocentrum cordatum]